MASPRPPWLGGQGEALPLPAGEARERQLGWHAVPTLPEAERKGEPGSGILEGRRMDVSRRTDATQSLPYPRQSETGNRGAGYMQAARVVSELSIRQTLTAIRLRQYAVLSDPLIRGDFVLGASFVAFAPSLGPGRVIASGNVRTGLLHEVLQEVDIV